MKKVKIRFKVAQYYQTEITEEEFNELYGFFDHDSNTYCPDAGWSEVEATCDNIITCSDALVDYDLEWVEYEKTSKIGNLFLTLCEKYKD